MSYKYSILMYNFNDYEIMREPEEIDPECEYIYVTDNPKLQEQTKVWKIIVDKDLNGLSTFDKCYQVRFNLFKYAITPVCIYLDGSYQIHKSLRKIYEDFMNSGSDLGLHIHFNRVDLLSEYNAWVLERNYPFSQYLKCLNYIHNNGYDFTYKGLYECSFRICKNTELNRTLDEQVLNTLKMLGSDNTIERLDQPMYCFILNKYFSDKMKIFPISPCWFFTGYMNHCAHRSKQCYPNMSRFTTKGYVFNNVVDLYL